MRLRHQRGDTLIEILFAFAILASIVGFAFSSAMQSYKAAVQAQNQTQAYLLAQYQADGLKTYRDSLEWDSSSGLIGSFLDGSNPSPGVLPIMRNKIFDVSNVGERFCMKANPQTLSSVPYQWAVESNTVACDESIASIAPNLKNAKMWIELSNPQASEEPDSPNLVDVDRDDPNLAKVTATVTIEYDIPNASVKGVITNRIFLTEAK